MFKGDLVPDRCTMSFLNSRIDAQPIQPDLRHFVVTLAHAYAPAYRNWTAVNAWTASSLPPLRECLGMLSLFNLRV